MKAFLFLVFLLIYCASIGQVDHWESIVKQGDTCTYLLPNTELDPGWKTLAFDDSSWLSGPTGIGYGDGDDATVIPHTNSVYIRQVFDLISFDDIEKLIFHMDYDDGYVAYLNGIEIARANVSGNPPAFNQTSVENHEAVGYRGSSPEGIILESEQIQFLLNSGKNLLAVQVHNVGPGSSDLSAIPFLTLGINNTNFSYRNPPSWFVAPVVLDSSKLPIVVIETSGQSIVDDPKVTAEIGIIFNGPGNINRITDEYNEYSGLCGIEIRGESSQSFAKKSYGFEFRDENGNDLDTSFLNFPSEEDFILYGPYSDKSLLNNSLAMKLANDLGQYASRTQFAEVIINGDYKGVYLIMEKVKRDKKRVDIARLTTEDVAEENIKGGYIFRIDKGEYDGWQSKYNAYNSDNKVFFQFYYPNGNTILDVQKAYLKGYVDDFEDALFSFDKFNSKGYHYTAYIDLRSFVDNFLINEISKNVDAYRLSSYFHKDKGNKKGKIKAGPVWDYNLAFGNANYCGTDRVTGWIYYQCNGSSPFWWHALFEDDLFTNALKCRWEEIKNTSFHKDTINTYLDQHQIYLSDAIARNYIRWPILGTYVWPNPDFFANPTSYEEILLNMQDWIERRYNWMDINIPGVAENCEKFDGDFTLDNRIEPNFDELNIYPNPASDYIIIENNSPIQKYILYDFSGFPLFQELVNSSFVQIELARFPIKGVYFIEVISEETSIINKIILH